MIPLTRANLSAFEMSFIVKSYTNRRLCLYLDGVKRPLAIGLQN